MRVTYDTKIWKAFGLQSRVGPKVGIELEYENAVIDDMPLEKIKKWHLEIDHSLRGGGVEFVSMPLDPGQINQALEEVQHCLSAVPAVVANKRCGVHVHVNALDLTFRELWSWLTYYQLVEAFIFKQYADGREENHFCVPQWANTNMQQNLYSDATALYRGVSKTRAADELVAGTFVPKGPVPLLMMSTSKYSAMNPSSLKQFGTLEFRQMRGTLSMAKVSEWAKFLVNLRDEAKSIGDAEEVLTEFENRGYERLCANIGLQQTNTVDPDDLTDCIDGAYMMVGHKPTNHQDLTWEIS